MAHFSGYVYSWENYQNINIKVDKGNINLKECMSKIDMTVYSKVIKGWTCNIYSVLWNICLKEERFHRTIGTTPHHFSLKKKKKSFTDRDSILTFKGLSL